MCAGPHYPNEFRWVLEEYSMDIGGRVSYVVCPWKFTKNVSILKAPVRNINALNFSLENSFTWTDLEKRRSLA